MCAWFDFGLKFNEFGVQILPIPAYILKHNPSNIIWQALFNLLVS